MDTITILLILILALLIITIMILLFRKNNQTSREISDLRQEMSKMLMQTREEIDKQKVLIFNNFNLHL